MDEAMSGARPTRPPGARAEPAFREHCVSCGRCVASCPNEALELDDDDLPHMPAVSACRLCMVCISSCPTPALRSLTRGEALREREQA
jgi:pyruvate formate lyase activating enzyme